MGYGRLFVDITSSEISKANLILQRVINYSLHSDNEKRNNFQRLLLQRQKAFLDEIQGTKEPLERNKLSHAYLLFIQTLDNCLKEPKHANKYMDNYYHSPDYIQLGGNKNRCKQTPMDRVVSGVSVLGIVSLTISFVLMLINLPAGLITFAIALTLLAPSFFYTLAETLPNKVQVSKEESALFEAALDLNLPSAKEDRARMDEYHTIAPVF